MSGSDRCLVTFWGTRGSLPTPGRVTEKYGGNTPCVSLRHGDTNIIIDAGTGIRNLGLELAEEISYKDDPFRLNLFLSHTHWDHIQGLPFFQPAYMKDTQLEIFGRKGSLLEKILGDQMDTNYFPIDMSQFAADLSIKQITQEPIQLGDVTVDWQEQIYHPGGCVRYRFTVNDKKVVYASDVELNKVFAPETPTAETEQQAQDYLDFVAGADLLIADGQYTAEEYETKKEWGHTSIPVILETAYRAGVKQVAVFHHDPLSSDKHLDELWLQHNSEYSTRIPAMTIFWAREGLTMAI